MRTDELDYDLPPELVASEPPAERDGGRLMVVDRAGQHAPEHRLVRDLVELIPAGALLVLNDTRVIPARLLGTRPTGGKAEIFLLRNVDATGARWRALGRANKSLRAGAEVRVGDGLVVHVEDRDERGGLLVRLECSGDPWAAIESHGQVPLPPYVRRAPRPEDRERYQTVFARKPGAVAAPTAGLHLTAAMLDALATRGVERATVTLHVGAGTFAPVEADDLDRHVMHSEIYEIPSEVAAQVRAARAAGRAVVAVGTTVVRTLETWAHDPAGALAGETRLLIQPGFEFRAVDQLVTNFHLPRSTLMALVMAFAGVDNVRSAYAVAVRERYRFFSYGDAMLLRGAPPPTPMRDSTP